MENIYTVHTFEDAGREINSPRSLEACLRVGIDPSELAQRGVRSFNRKGLEEDLVIKLHTAFEKKRKEKIGLVIAEREQLMRYNKSANPRTDTSNTTGATPTTPSGEAEQEDKVSAMLDLEKRRMEAVRRRQEKELQKIIQKEQALAALQQKLQRTEEEAVRKQRDHERKVRDQKIAADKKQTMRLNERAQKEREELEAAKSIARKEQEFEKKRRDQDAAVKKQQLQEAQERDQERADKMEQHRIKTEALIDSQFALAEKNRESMMAREEKVRAQLDEKKVNKAQEILDKREKAKVRIGEALHKHHDLHTLKETAFKEREEAATKRARAVESERNSKLKKESEDRDRRNRMRVQRLHEAARNRKDHRDSIVERRTEKDKTFDIIATQREEENRMRKFNNTIRQNDKLDNVERVNRMNEFRRLQTLQSIINADLRYEKIQESKHNMLDRHREESKHSLCRKHEISNAMDMMRMTNDFSLLDQLFTDKKGKKKRQKGGDDFGDTMPEERLAQTA
jgi:hypothetical protein